MYHKEFASKRSTRLKNSTHCSKFIILYLAFSPANNIHIYRDYYTGAIMQQYGCPILNEATLTNMGE